MAAVRLNMEITRKQHKTHRLLEFPLSRQCVLMKVKSAAECVCGLLFLITGMQLDVDVFV